MQCATFFKRFAASSPYSALHPIANVSLNVAQCFTIQSSERREKSKWLQRGHLADPAPLEVLQCPRTASSGRRLIVVSCGGSYGFLLSACVSSLIHSASSLVVHSVIRNSHIPQRPRSDYSRSAESAAARPNSPHRSLCSRSGAPIPSLPRARLPPTQNSHSPWAGTSTPITAARRCAT